MWEGLCGQGHHDCTIHHVYHVESVYDMHSASKHSVLMIKSELVTRSVTKHLPLHSLTWTGATYGGVDPTFIHSTKGELLWPRSGEEKNIERHHSRKR